MAKTPSVETLASRFSEAARRLREAVSAAEFRRHVNAAMGSVPKGRGGANLQLTPEVQQQICTLIRLGCTWEEAAAGVGLDDKTLLRWRALGEKAQEGVYREFFDAVAVAQRGRKPYFLAELMKAGKKDPATLRWLAERVPGLRNFFRPPRVDVEINRELEHVLERLKRRLPPDLYEIVLSAAVDEDDGGGSGEDPQGEAGPATEGGGQALRAALATPEAGGGAPD